MNNSNETQSDSSNSPEHASLRYEQSKISAAIDGEFDYHLEFVSDNISTEYVGFDEMTPRSSETIKGLTLSTTKGIILSFESIRSAKHQLIIIYKQMQMEYQCQRRA